MDETTYNLELTKDELKAFAAFREAVTNLADMTGDLNRTDDDSCGPYFVAMHPVWQKLQALCAEAGV
jgi:hypothetical protein